MELQIWAFAWGDQEHRIEKGGAIMGGGSKPLIYSHIPGKFVVPRLIAMRGSRKLPHRVGILGGTIGALCKALPRPG